MLQKIYFNGPLDSDTSPEAFKDGMGRYRKDVRIFSSENGESESAEIARGNSVVTFSLPSGTNTVIGAYEYKKNKKIYYFVHNTFYNHLILEYDYVTGTIAKVFQDSVNILNGETNILNFRLTHLITGINVVELDSNNHLLYWTDGYVNPADQNDYNEPKKINIEKGKYFMQADYINGYKFPFNPEILYRIKQPSKCGPTYAWTMGLHEISVTSITTQDSGTDPDLAVPPGGDVTVAFDSIVYDASNEFNVGTYTWTVGQSNQYNVIATVNVATDVLGVGDANLSIFVNGVAVETTSIAPLLTTAYGGAIFTVQYNQLSLTATDTVTIVIANLQTGTSLTVIGVSFMASIVKVNYLFKLYPVFKTQFVYDDNDVSSWSPWSPFAFPSVTRDNITGNEIVSQSDTITVTVDTGISIVTKIRIAVKMVGTYLVNNVLEPFEFSLIAELNKADLGISDDSTYGYIFLNDGNYTPLYINESIKLFDSVPLASQAQEVIIDGRIVDGCVTENQDLTAIDIIMSLSYKDVETFDNWSTLITPASFLKSGGIYKYGIVYSDHAGRLTTSNIQRGAFDVLLPNGTYGTTLYVPFLTESDYNAPHATPNTDMKYVPQVNMDIYNPPPAWATHFFIVRSKNEAITKYFQFVAQAIDYTDGNGTVVAANVANTLVVNISNITGRYLQENGTSQLVYDFIKGDRIRFIANKSGGGPSYSAISAFLSFNDNEISSYDSGTGDVTITMNSSVPQTLAYGCLFEIYTPARNVIDDNEFMYEIGECYELDRDIHNNLIHTFSTSNQLINSFTSSSGGAGTITCQLATGHGITLNSKVKVYNSNYSVHGIVTVSNATNVVVTYTEVITGIYGTAAGTIIVAASGTLKSGDCFRINQDMPWVTSGSVNRMYSYVENMNISNLWTSNAWDYARPNRVDDSYHRITRFSNVLWSQQFIPETLINGLSTVYDTDFQTYEQKYGSIQKLYNHNLFLDVYQELKVATVPIQQSVMMTTQGQNFIGQTTEILPRVPQYYTGEFGIGKNPESFAVYGSARYFIDTYRSAVLRLSNDGLDDVSNIYNMHNYFTDKCADVLAYPSKVNIYGVYDVKFDEYVISFQNIASSPGKPSFVGETLAFNEKKKAWSTFYSYLPDYLCSNGINIVSFKSGSLYTHNTSSLYANYYGVQYKPLLWFYCNVAPSNVKIFEALSIEGLDAWAATIETPITNENPSGQTTALLNTNFELKEGIWYSEILKDDNTPNIVPFPVLLPNARFEGNPMRGVYALIKLEFQGTAYSKIFAANILVIGSERSNK